MLTEKLGDRNMTMGEREGSFGKKMNWQKDGDREGGKTKSLGTKS